MLFVLVYDYLFSNLTRKNLIEEHCWRERNQRIDRVEGKLTFLFVTIIFSTRLPFSRLIIALWEIETGCYAFHSIARFANASSMPLEFLFLRSCGLSGGNWACTKNDLLLMSWDHLSFQGRISTCCDQSWRSKQSDSIRSMGDGSRICW